MENRPENRKDYSIWDLETFKEEIFNLYPEGELNLIYNIVRSNVEKQVFTFQELKDKWAQYIKSREPYQNGKYTPQKYRIVELDDFINKGMFHKSFANEIIKSNPVRDEYLYGTPPK